MVSFSTSHAEPKELNLERSICGLKEPFIFWMWSRAAGTPNPSRLRLNPNVEATALKSKDGRILQGYKLTADRSPHDDRAQKGYLLVVQGNATLADQVITSFRDIANAGYDVYVFDYRGYGRSEGKRRLKAMLSDYQEIISHLDSMAYGKRAFYGISFGGIILLDALRGQSGETPIVIDSAPSSLSDYGCPQQHDPVANLPKSANRFLIIVGANDRIVGSNMSKPLVDLAEQRGASIVRDPRMGHPFMDGYNDERLGIVKRFLTGKIDRPE